MAHDCNSKSTLDRHIQAQLRQSSPSALKDGAVQETSDLGSDVYLNNHTDAVLQKADPKIADLEGNGDEQEENFLYDDVVRHEAEGEEKVEIAGAATSWSDDSLSGKREEGGSEAGVGNRAVLEGKGEQCYEEEEEGEKPVEEVAAGAYATGLNGGVCKNQESEPVDCEMDGAVLKKGEMRVSGNEEMLKVDGKTNEQNCCMKIEVVDETALVGFGKEGNDINFSENSRKNVNQKRPRRRGKSGKTNSSGADENQEFLDVGLAQNCGNQNKEEGGKRVYSRKELEALRFVGVDWQRKKWTEVYCGLGPALQEEYDGLVDSDDYSQCRRRQQQQKKKKHIRVDFNPRFRNEARSSVLGAVAAKGSGYHLRVFVH